MTHVVFADGVSEGETDEFLSEDFGKALRPEPTVEGLVGLGSDCRRLRTGHPMDATGGLWARRRVRRKQV
jgi:hypothetical protein